jgi:hypothetical protein
MTSGTMLTACRLHRHWRALPIGDLTEVIGAGNCLVLAPHPDDESLGCGGLIARCCIESRPPVVVILTDGSGSHPGSQDYPPQKLAALREQEVARATQALGLPTERLMFLREVDTQAPQAGPAFDHIVARLIAWLRAYDCSAIVGGPRNRHAGDVRAELECITGGGSIFSPPGMNFTRYKCTGPRRVAHARQRGPVSAVGQVPRTGGIAALSPAYITDRP